MDYNLGSERDDLFGSWNVRKKELFTAKYIKKVWHYLISMNFP